MNTHICPICEMGQLRNHSEIVTVEHLDQQGEIESRYAVCDSCGSEQVAAADAAFNKRAMIALNSGQ